MQQKHKLRFERQINTGAGVKQTGVGGQERVGMEAGGEGERRRGEGKFEMGEADWKIGAWKGKEDRRGAEGHRRGCSRGCKGSSVLGTVCGPHRHQPTDPHHHGRTPQT